MKRHRLSIRDWLEIGLVVLVLAPYVQAQVPSGGIHHKFHSTMADSADPRQIQPSHWNDALQVDTLQFGAMGHPLVTLDGDMWLEASGSPPSRIISIKVRDNGVDRTIASITF